MKEKRKAERRQRTETLYASDRRKFDRRKK